MSLSLRKFNSYALVACVLWACSSEPGYDPEQDLIPPDGKFDTAYFSSLATELDGTFTGVIEMDVSHLDEQGQQEELGFYQSDPNALKQLVQSQVKLAKHQLNEQKLHMNLTAGEIEVVQMSLEQSFLKIHYTVATETLVTYKELEEVGVTPEDLLDKTYEVIVAADPRDLLGRAQENCATGHDPGTLIESNYFYYFDPHKEGCTLPMASTSNFQVHALLPQIHTYPEYDRLTEDGLLEIVVFFGQADSAPVVSAGDWGVMMWRTFEVNLRLAGFEKIEGLAVGQRYARTKAGLYEIVDLVSPYDIHDLGSESFNYFAQSLQTHEIIFYNGHSFYGSLNVMNERGNFPENTYQILFMNSCWSYEYYTKQVFENKITDLDPTGWDLADVVNNTTYAYFTQMETSSRVLLFNLLAGAESMGQDEEGRHFTWQRIIGIMNDEARGVCPVDADPMDCRHYQPKNAHEIYGVSGVRENSYRP
jgi:hypothetical protein